MWPQLGLATTRTGHNSDRPQLGPATTLPQLSLWPDRRQALYRQTEFGKFKADYFRSSLSGLSADVASELSSQLSNRLIWHPPDIRRSIDSRGTTNLNFLIFFGADEDVLIGAWLNAPVSRSKTGRRELPGSHLQGRPSGNDKNSPGEDEWSEAK